LEGYSPLAISIFSDFSALESGHRPVISIGKIAQSLIAANHAFNTIEQLSTT
jgi:hypothetical protein